MKKNEIDETSKKTVDEAVKTESGGFKKVKYGSMSLVTIALVIALVVIFNLMASYMAKRQPLKIDLTADKRYELSDETIDFLRDKLDKDVEIVVTCPKDDFENISQNIEYMIKYYYSAYYNGAEVNVDCPFDMIPILLEKYEMYASQGDGSIKVKYVDLDKEPTAVKKYGDIYGEEITNQSIVIACGERARVISKNAVDGMIVPDLTDPSRVSLSFAGESTITSEIMNVTDENPINVAFASKFNGGNIYNEKYTDSVSGLREQLLTKNGYFCTDIDLSADELDREKYDMVVVPMPQVDFDRDTIEKISAFLYNDGLYDRDMLFVADPMASNIPNITEFLADWSIGISDGNMIADTEMYMSNSPISIQVKQADSEEAGEKVSGSLKLVSPMSGEVKILSKNNEAITASVLETYGSAFNFDLATNEQQDDGSVKNVGVISRKEKQIGNQVDNYYVAQSHVLVFGSGYLTSTEFLTQTNLYSNVNVLINIVNQMTGKNTETVIIPDKALQQAVMAPTAAQDKRIRIFVIFIIPAIVAAIGLVVLIRRKNR